MEDGAVIPQKINHRIIRGSSNSTLRVHLEEVKAGTQTHTCTPMFTAALFTIVKRWRLPGCPPTEEWSIHTMEYYSAFKKKCWHMLQHKWTLKTLLYQVKKSVTKGQILYDSPSMRFLEQSSFIETEGRTVAAGAGGGQNEELVLNGYRAPVRKKWRSSRDRWWWWLNNNVNVLNTTELYIQKWLTW